MVTGGPRWVGARVVDSVVVLRKGSRVAAEWLGGYIETGEFGGRGRLVVGQCAVMACLIYGLVVGEVFTSVMRMSVRSWLLLLTLLG